MEKITGTFHIPQYPIKYVYIDIDDQCCFLAEDIFSGLRLKYSENCIFEEGLFNSDAFADEIFDLNITSLTTLNVDGIENCKLITPMGVAIIIYFTIHIG